MHGGGSLRESGLLIGTVGGRWGGAKSLLKLALIWQTSKENGRSLIVGIAKTTQTLKTDLFIHQGYKAHF